MRRHRPGRVQDRSAFAGFRFPPEVITVAVRWYLRYGLSYRDLEERRCCVRRGRARLVRAAAIQIARASSPNAVISRRAGGASTASS
jgi:hypothetical protein